MGRRKIEIKAIKDDRNRSVTFLKRKGGLFKKAHELSVLCSVDVAVFIFGNNKKLYEYSSSDMGELITRYQFHGGPSEHKGPSDFNANNDDEEDEEGDGTPPRAPDGMADSQMMPPQYHGQAPFPQIRHHTPSASPPINNGTQFTPHPAAHPVQRVHTPQPPITVSRPGSRNDVRRLGPGGMPVPQGAPHPGITYMPTPPIYNPPPQANMMPQPPPPAPYQPYPPQPNQMPQPQQYLDDRRASMPPAFSSQPPSQGIQAPVRPTPSPQPMHQQLPPNPIPHISPPPPQPPQMERRLHDPLPPPPPPPVEPKPEPQERPKMPLLNTDTAIKKMPRKTHSIFTPIEENRSILSQHLASFAAEPVKPDTSAAAANASNRSQSVDVGAMSRSNTTSSPQLPQRANTQADDKSRPKPMATIPEATFTPPSRTSSLKVGGGAGGGARPRGPRLKVTIPGDGGSDPGSATLDSSSPRNATETTTIQPPQRHNSQSSLVLPPPSPSASAILSAGATGPPNPFARPVPQQSVNGGDTPVSALPSRFLNNEFLPSPSSFYHDWPFRGGDSNTLPSPLNFATPVVGSGPSFLRDDNTPNNGISSLNSLSVNNGSNPIAAKRKTPEITNGPSEPPEPNSDSKRVRVE